MTAWASSPAEKGSLPRRALPWARHVVAASVVASPLLLVACRKPPTVNPQPVAASSAAPLGSSSAPPLSATGTTAEAPSGRPLEGSRTATSLSGGSLPAFDTHATPASSSPAGLAGDAAGSADQDGRHPLASPGPYGTAPFLSGKSVGHTSVVFKVQLQGGLKAAWKPRSHRGDGRYRGEVAAYRLACALGIANVPPAFPRGVPAVEVQKAFRGNGSAFNLLREEAIVESDGSIHGAIIPWIENFEELPLESPRWRPRLRAWLGKGGSPQGEGSELAGQVSTMIVFDHLISNWDRWSGGNVAIDREHNRVLYIDNDGAFREKEAGGARSRLDELHRFSKAFRQRLAAMDKETMAEALGTDSDGSPLLSSKALAEADTRRRYALALMEKRISEEGEAAVLIFE